MNTLKIELPYTDGEWNEYIDEVIVEPVSSDSLTDDAIEKQAESFAKFLLSSVPITFLQQLTRHLIDELGIKFDCGNNTKPLPQTGTIMEIPCYVKSDMSIYLRPAVNDDLLPNAVNIKNGQELANIFFGRTPGTFTDALYEELARLYDKV